ncbi:MAG: hypothetical protein WBD13_23220, partial [Burkholderiaceae bacterium]
MHQSYQPKRKHGLLTQLRARLSQSHRQIADTSAVFGSETGMRSMPAAQDPGPQITTGAAYAHNGWLSLV